MQTETEDSDVVWARVDEGFYVGSRPGHFLGCIDRHDDGSFVALDTHTRPIGTYARLTDAMDAVADGAAVADRAVADGAEACA